MPNFVDEIAADLVTETIATAQGTDIFNDHMPDVSADPTIAVKDTGGVPAMNSPTPVMTMQVLVRSAAYITARQKAAEIYNRYHSCGALTLTSFQILNASAFQLPSSIGTDNANRSLVSFNIGFTAYATTQASGATGYGGSKDPVVPTS